MRQVDARRLNARLPGKQTGSEQSLLGWQGPRRHHVARVDDIYRSYMLLGSDKEKFMKISDIAGSQRQFGRRMSCRRVFKRRRTAVAALLCAGCRPGPGPGSVASPAGVLAPLTCFLRRQVVAGVRAPSPQTHSHAPDAALRLAALRSLPVPTAEPASAVRGGSPQQQSWRLPAARAAEVQAQREAAPPLPRDGPGEQRRR